MKKKIYISGAISDIPLDEARRRFADAEAELRERGFEVLNPFDNGLYWSDPWGDHMKADIKMMFEAQSVFMLRGWESSRGAALEHHIAGALSMEITYQS